MKGSLALSQIMVVNYLSWDVKGRSTRLRFQAFTGSAVLIAIRVLRPSYVDDIVKDSTWSTRGWTYQERLNSTRILYVLEHRLVLDCRKDT